MGSRQWARRKQCLGCGTRQASELPKREGRWPPKAPNQIPSPVSPTLIAACVSPSVTHSDGQLWDRLHFIYAATYAH